MHAPERADRLRAAAAAAVLLAACALSCVHGREATWPGTSPSPGERWVPPEGAVAPPPEAAPAEASALPEDLLENASSWTLGDLIDLALRNSPQTRITWARARSAAASLGAEKGYDYPAVYGQVSETRIKGSAVGGKFTFKSESFSPYVQLNWILLDFGAREGRKDSARAALMAADWQHNQAIQDVVLAVEQAYYQYLDAVALEKAEQSSVAEATASLDAAERRRAAGLATVGDVLQAKTRLSEARLQLQTVGGQIQTIRGAVATAVGLPANTPFDIEIPTPEIPADRAAVEVENAIRTAQAQRPELAAARARAEQAEADVRAQRAKDRPTLGLAANGGQIYYDALSVHQNIYSAQLLLTIPIFNGFTYQYNLQKAEADRDAARASLESLEQEITLQVWTAYFDHKTADGKLDTARDLVESASQSFDVASARYKAGVGSILDLLIAQSALESARAQEVRSRTEWFLTLARLAHDTGTLAQPGPAEAPGPSTKGTP